jgi:hypothetical protein
VFVEWREKRQATIEELDIEKQFPPFKQLKNKFES